jgi:hypothetical protein
MMADGTWRPILPVLRKTYASIAARRALRIVVAMHRHQLRHGKLPATLRELVPTFLATLPADPLDNAPFAADPAERVIYSTLLGQKVPNFDANSLITREPVGAARFRRPNEAIVPAFPKE